MSDDDELRAELAELRDEHIVALEVLADVARLLGRPNMRVEEVVDALRVAIRERDESQAFFRRTAMTGGSIVSSVAMTETQIAIARAADRMIVTTDGYGFVYVPGPR